MKTTLLLCGLLVFGAGYSQAQVTARRVTRRIAPAAGVAGSATAPVAASKASAGVNSINADAWRQRRIRAAHGVPMRIYGDRLFDFTNVILNRNDFAEPSTFRIAGKVLQVINDGLLIDTGRSGPNEIVLLKNYPGQDKLVDNTRVSVPAFMTTERYRYQSVNGGVKTIPVWDWGKPLPGSGRKFDVVTIVWNDAIGASVVKFEP